MGSRITWGLLAACALAKWLGCDSDQTRWTPALTPEEEALAELETFAGVDRQSTAMELRTIFGPAELDHESEGYRLLQWVDGAVFVIMSEDASDTSQLLEIAHPRGTAFVRQKLAAASIRSGDELDLLGRSCEVIRETYGEPDLAVRRLRYSYRHADPGLLDVSFECSNGVSGRCTKVRVRWRAWK